jgi:NhaP-type Na+/H+ and K+/H+ antiporter
MILELGEPQFNALVSALSKTKPTLLRGQFSKEISNKVKNLQADELHEILRVLYVLYSMKQRAEISAQELAEDVSKSCVESSSDKIQFPKEKAKALIARLKQLLSFEKTVAVTTKAFDVMTEHKYIFCSARIMSDIRPVFTNHPESASAAVIIHNLQIGFHEGGTKEHKEFYVALDTDDIQALKEVINRAERKTIALQTIIKSSKLPYLEV